MRDFRWAKYFCSKRGRLKVNAGVSVTMQSWCDQITAPRRTSHVLLWAVSMDSFIRNAQRKLISTFDICILRRYNIIIWCVTYTRIFPTCIPVCSYFTFQLTCFLYLPHGGDFHFLLVPYLAFWHKQGTFRTKETAVII